MSQIRKLAGETVIYGLSSILPRLLQFAIGTSYITHKFAEQENVGLFNVLYAYTAVILTVMLFRLDTAFFRFAKDKMDVNRVFGTALIPLLITTTITCALVIINADSITHHLAARDTPQYLRWFALIIGFDTIAMLFYARFRFQQRPYRFLFYRLGNVILYIFFLLLFLEVLPRWWPEGLEPVHRLFDITMPIDYTFVANVIASILVLVTMIPEFFSVEWQFDSKLFRRMIAYSWPLVVVGLAGVFSQTFAAPLQELFLSDDLVYNLRQAGIYGSGAKLAILLNLIIMAFNYAAEPFFFKNADHKDSKDTYGHIALLFTIVTCAAVIGIVSYLDILQYIIGPEYRTGITVVPYLLFSFVGLGLYYNFSIWYKLSDRTGIGAILSISGMLIMLIINIYGLPRIGYMASAYASLACYTFMAVAGYLTGRHYYPINYPIAWMVRYIVLSVVSVVLLTVLRSAGIDYVWLWGTVAISVYAAMVWVDRDRIRALIG